MSIAHIRIVSISTAGLASLAFATAAAAAPFGPGAHRRVRRVALVGRARERRRRRGRHSLIGATRSVGDGRQALVAEGRAGQPPVQTRLLGASGDITSQPRAVVDDQGHGAVVFARGNTAYLSVCKKGSCATPVKVGSSALKPTPTSRCSPATGGSR